MSKRALTFFSTNTEEAAVVLAHIDNLIDAIIHVDDAAVESLNAKAKLLEASVEGMTDDTFAQKMVKARVVMIGSIVDLMTKHHAYYQKEFKKFADE